MCLPLWESECVHLYDCYVHLFPSDRSSKRAHCAESKLSDFAGRMQRIIFSCASVWHNNFTVWMCLLCQYLSSGQLKRISGLSISITYDVLKCCTWICVEILSSFPLFIIMSIIYIYFFTNKSLNCVVLVSRNQNVCRYLFAKLLKLSQSEQQFGLGVDFD